MIPRAFRSAVGKRLWATMEFLADHAPAGPVLGGEVTREIAKAAADRRRTVLEHRADDHLRAYFQEERLQATKAARAGRDVGDAVKSLEDDLRETYRGIWSRSAAAWERWTAGRPTGGVGKAAGDAPVEAWLRRNAGKRVKGISETTRKALAREVAAGVEAGESAAEIARRIDELYLDEIIPDRSMVIARTEVGAAVNWQQHWQAERAGVEMEKEWLALRDDRTRDDHAAADGQRVPMDEPFEVGGDRMMHPMDASLGADPEQIINCRCSVAYHVVAPGDRKMKRSPSDLQAFEKFDPDQPRDPDGRWSETGAGGRGASDSDPSATPENRARARERRAFGDGEVLRYTGGSKVALADGEHVTVTGVYGMSEKTGTIYYTVRAADGSRFTIASHALRAPRPGEVAAPPAPRAPKVPKQPAPAKAPEPAAEEPRAGGDVPDYSKMSVKQIETKLAARTGSKVSLKGMDPAIIPRVADAYDRLAMKYPPEISAGFRFTTYEGKGNVIGSADSGGIVLNASLKHFGNADSLSRNAAYSEKIEWHLPGSSDPMETVYHEFGHRVDRYISNKIWQVSGDPKKWAGGVFTRGNPAQRDRWNERQAEWEDFIQSNYESVAPRSKYVRSKKDKVDGVKEAFAEAFMQHELAAAGKYKGPLTPGVERLGPVLDKMLRWKK